MNSESIFGRVVNYSRGVFGTAVTLVVVTLVVSALGTAAIVLTPAAAHALPFNQDMSYGQNMPAGSIMRPRVANTMPIGSAANYVGTREDVQSWTNPRAGNKLSVRNGERLYAVNCSPCHGNYSIDGAKLTFKPGAVASQVPGPDITDPSIALMPAYGWKLSKTENWDIVSYVRKVQAVRTKGK